jgi:hypothetical protein
MSDDLKLTKTDRERIKNYFVFRYAMKVRSDFLASAEVKALSNRVYKLYTKDVTHERAHTWNQLVDQLGNYTNRHYNPEKFKTYQNHLNDYIEREKNRVVSYEHLHPSRVEYLVRDLLSSLDGYHPGLCFFDDKGRSVTVPLVNVPSDTPMAQERIEWPKRWGGTPDFNIPNFYNYHHLSAQDTPRIFDAELFRCGTWKDAVALWPALEAARDLVIFRKDGPQATLSNNMALVPWTAAQRKAALKNIASL